MSQTLFSLIDGQISVGGSIYIGSGIVGQTKSFIKGGKYLQTTFVNEGDVEVGGDIEVTQTILHSICRANGEITCTKGKGLIIGGQISASKTIQANEIGNEMQTKTSLYIGVHQHLVEKQQSIEIELAKSKDELLKLNQLLKTYLEKERKEGKLEGRQKLMMFRVLQSFRNTKEKVAELSEEIEQFKELRDLSDEGTIEVKRTIYPNVSVYFGKYKRTLFSAAHNSRISLLNSEITFS